MTRTKKPATWRAFIQQTALVAGYLNDLEPFRRDRNLQARAVEILSISKYGNRDIARLLNVKR